MVDFRPKGYHTVTPILCVKGAKQVVEFMQKAFDEVEVKHCSLGEDGTIKHAEVRIGDSWIMLGEGDEKHKPQPTSLYIYVPDTDKIYKQALKAGATSKQEPTDMFYGDRNAGVVDTAGNQWWIGTHIEDLTDEEIGRRAQEFHKQAVAAK